MLVTVPSADAGPDDLATHHGVLQEGAGRLCVGQNAPPLSAPAL